MLLSLVLVGVAGFFAYDAGWKAFTVLIMVLVIGALESFVKPPNILRFGAKAGLTVFVMWWIVLGVLPIKTFLGLVGAVFMCGVVILGGFWLTDGEWW
jgi:hypothetical protein